MCSVLHFLEGLSRSPRVWGLGDYRYAVRYVHPVLHSKDLHHETPRAMTPSCFLFWRETTRLPLVELGSSTIPSVERNRIKKKWNLIHKNKNDGRILMAIASWQAMSEVVVVETLVPKLAKQQLQIFSWTDQTTAENPPPPAFGTARDNDPIDCKW